MYLYLTAWFTSGCNVLKDICTIKKKFSNLKMATRLNIQEKVPDNNVGHLVDTIMNLPVVFEHDDEEYLSEKCSTLRKAESVPAVFDHLSFHWDYLHPDLYSYLIDEFNLSHLLPTITQYEMDLDEFLNKTPLKEFCKIEKKRKFDMSVNFIQKEFAKLVTGHCWSHPVYLSQVQQFRMECAKYVGLRQCAFRICDILIGSVIVTQLVPISIEMRLKSIVNDQNFLRTYSIVYMNFNGTVIYKEVRNCIHP